MCCNRSIKLIILLALFTSVQAQTIDEISAARDIIKNWQDAIVTAKIVVRYQMATGGREMSRNENVTEAIATIIDPSGLAVLSLSNTDPTSLLSGFSYGGVDMEGPSWESFVSDVKMIMADGEEIPSKVLLRDKDLDLVFIRPRDNKNRTFIAVDLSKNSDPEVMDKILVLSRLGRVGDRAPYISLCRIQAIVKKPRTFYFSSLSSVENSLGAPVFSLDGRTIGIVLLRILKSKQPMMFGGMFGGTGVLPIILPAENILKVAKQAAEVK